MMLTTSLRLFTLILSSMKQQHDGTFSTPKILKCSPLLITVQITNASLNLGAMSMYVLNQLCLQQCPFESTFHPMKPSIS